MVICLERDADLHMAQLMPLPITVSCFSKIQICFTFLVPAYPGSPGQKAVKRVRVNECVCVCYIQGGPKKPGLFFRLDNFVTVSPRKACSVSKFSQFYREKGTILAFQ